MNDQTSPPGGGKIHPVGRLGGRQPLGYPTERPSTAIPANAVAGVEHSPAVASTRTAPTPRPARSR